MEWRVWLRLGAGVMLGQDVTMQTEAVVGLGWDRGRHQVRTAGVADPAVAAHGILSEGNARSPSRRKGLIRRHHVSSTAKQGQSG